MSSTPDPQTTIGDLKKRANTFIEERDWGKHHTQKNLAVSIAIETAELMEHYQWDDYTVNDQQKQTAIQAELADIIIYCLYFANAANIDIAQAVTTKLDTAAAKYPAELFNQDSDDPADYEKIKKQYRNDQ